MAANDEYRDLKKYDIRQYQIDLYKSAKNQNLIACLGTGTGKTFISILLMSDSQYLPQLNGSYIKGKAKRTFFLVPTRPLVQQQTSVIRSSPQTSDLKVGGFTGDMNVDFWDKSRWDEELEKHQVIVMTPQILLDMLNHSFITFDKINLLVVDEVHWGARKKNKKESGHPYKQIMKRYNELDLNLRPRVLGLSATPINCSMKVEKFSEAVEDIEKTYSAICMTGDVSNYGTNPKEIVWGFTNCDSKLSLSGGAVVKSLELFVTSLKGTLKSFKDQRKCPTVLMRMKKILSTIKNILSDPEKNERTLTDEQTGEKYPLFMTWMGIWCASVAINFYIQEIDEYKKVYESVDQLHHSLWECGLKYLREIQKTFELEINLDEMAALNTASPKMHRLLELLRKYQPNGGNESTLCGIIFVNQRCVARVLCDWLMELKRLQPHYYGFLNVGWVVGHSARPGIEAKIAFNSDKRQQAVIRQFHDKQLNLLVATSVLEEGLDVRICNLVVRYDRLNTFREYLQSKGRARAEDAYYYMMTADEDSHKLWMKLNDFLQMEDMVKNINSKQRTDSSPELIRSDEEDKDPDLVYTCDKTGAQITGRSAVSLLYKYCQKLPSDSFTRLEPVFSVEEDIKLHGFRATIKLPVNCPLRKTFSMIIGPLKKDRDVAKRAAALKACKQLHKIRELNDHLLPIKKETTIRQLVHKLGLREETMDNNQKIRVSHSKVAVGTRSRKDIIPKLIAKVFTSDKNRRNGYYLHRIGLIFSKTDSLPNNCLTYGIITRKPIVNRSLFSIYLKTMWNCDDGVVNGIQNSEVKVEFLAVKQIDLSAEEKESIEKFHCFTFEEVLRFSVEDFAFDSINSDFNLLVVPLKNGSAIDWTFINRINTFGAIEVKYRSEIERLSYRFDEQSFNDCIFYPCYRQDINGRPFVYFSLRVSDLNSRSQWIGSKDYQTFEEYFSKRHNINIENKNLPLIEGRAINKANKGVFKGAQLKPYSTGKKDKWSPEYYPPELICIHPFPASLWRQAQCLPAVLYRLNHLYLSEELRQRIHSETKPTINLNSDNNCLELKSESSPEYSKSGNNAFKRRFTSMDSDDECEGHPFDDDMDVDCPKRYGVVKKRRKNITIEMANTSTTTRMIVNTTMDFVAPVGGNPLQNLLRYTNALIKSFNEMFFSHVNNRDQLRDQLVFSEIMSGINSPQQTKFPDLRYGEAFPFVFKGNIEPYIRESYDAKVGDSIVGPNVDRILQALTMVGANDAFNLERLEVIGDSFLKLVSSAFVYFSCPDVDEGRLSYLRQIQICNCNLYFIGCEKHIDKHLVSHKWFPNNNWLIPSYDISDENDLKILDKESKRKDDKNSNKRTDSFKHQIVNNKSIADSVEALIGAHLMIGGNKSALIFMEWLGLKVRPMKDDVPHPIDYLNESNLSSDEIFRWLFSPKEPFCRSDLSEQEINDFIHKHFIGANLQHFEKIIGYEFRNKAYLIEAMTHSSYHFNEYTDCYQKLEFLGDAIIDYLISRHIFATPNKKFSPGELTDLRSALVNNAFFAAIAVKYKFHKFLKNLSPDLFRAIQNFEKNFSAGATDSVKNSFNKLTEEDCTDVEEIEVPKALGDIFESVAGAIFLDNGLSLDGVWKVYYKLLKPEIDYFTENIPKMSVQMVWELCPSGSVEFGECEKIGRKIRVVLTAKGKKYGGVGKNRKFAKIAASKNALKDLAPI